MESFFSESKIDVDVKKKVKKMSNAPLKK